MTGTTSRMDRLGQIIRSTRKERGWSQNDLATHAGVSRPSIARIEGGDDVSTATLDKVAEVLGLQLNLTDRGRSQR